MTVDGAVKQQEKSRDVDRWMLVRSHVSPDDGRSVDDVIMRHQMDDVRKGLYYRRRSLWRFPTEGEAFLPRNIDNRLLVTTQQGKGSWIWTDGQLTIVEGTRLPNVPLEDVTQLMVSPGGSCLGAVQSGTIVVLLMPLGVVHHAMNMSQVIDDIVGFQFLSERSVVVSSSDGTVVVGHMTTGLSSVVAKTSRYHRYPQLTLHRSRQNCLMTGYLDGTLNVTLWNYDDDFQSWQLLSTLRSPISGFRSWMLGSSEVRRWCMCDYAPDGSKAVISMQTSSPWLLKIENDRLSVAESMGDATETVKMTNGAVFLDDGTLAMTTDVDKMVFVEIGDGYGRVLATESVSEVTQLMGRYGDQALACLSLEASPDSGELMLHLIEMKKQHPSEHLAYLVENQEFEAAMKMAEVNGLSKEGIYKALWMTKGDAPVASSDLEAILEHVHDRRWILETCETAIGRSFEDQHNIVIHGRGIAEDMLRQNSKDGKCIDIYIKWIRITEALDTFRALHSGSYSADAYRQFRSKLRSRIAKDFAKSGNICALQVLLQHHSHSLFDSLLTILEALPCTISSRLCKGIYPRVGMSPAHLGYQSHEHIHLITPLKDLGIDITMLSTVEHLPDVLLADIQTKNPSDMPQLTENQIHVFYHRLAQRIEKETGNLSMTVEALQIGIGNGGDQLTRSLDQLTTFNAWMSIGNAFWDWDVESFSRLSIFERIDRCLQSINDNDLPSWIQHQMTTLMETLPHEEKKKTRVMLIQCILQRSTDILRTIMSEVGLDGVLFDASPEGIKECMDAAVKAIESIDKIDNWDAVYASLDMLKDRAVSFGDRLDVTSLDNVRDRCHVGVLLQKHGMHLPYTRLRHLSPSDGDRLIKGVLGHAMRSGSQWSDLQWNTLFSDCVVISQIVNKAEDIDHVKLDYFRTLLRACKFDLAESFMDDAMDTSTAEDVTWTIGREMLCSLTDLDNLNIIDEAKQCFDLFPSSQRARREVQKLKTLTNIRSNFGIVLLPAELETPDFEADLIDSILAKNEKQYRKRAALLTICKDLEFDDDAFYDAWQKLCRVALRFHDLRSAMDLMNDLRERNLSRSWTLAMEIVEEDRCQEYLSLEDKEALWSFIVVHCDDGLQGCIERMQPSLMIPDVTAAFQETDRRDAADAYLYYADADYRGTMKAQKLPAVEQRCSVYGFVYEALMSINNVNSETAGFVRKLLESSLQEITELLKKHPEYLTTSLDDQPDVPSFDDHLATLREHDQLRVSFRLIQSILPALDASKFCNADNDAYRKNIVLELAAYAGELLYRRNKDDSHVQKTTVDPMEVLKMAMEQGVLFGVDNCTVHSRCVTALCALVDGPFDVMETAVVSSETVLKTEHDREAYIDQIVNTVWSGIVDRYAVAFILRICVRSLSSSISSDVGIGQLKAYAARIIEMDPLQNFDFRIPIYPILLQLMTELFGCGVNWKPEISEMQNIYNAVTAENWKAICELYDIVSTQSPMDSRPTAGSVGLCITIKQLQHTPWSSQFKETTYWKETVADLQLNHLEAIIEYLIFGEETLLLTLLSSLNTTTSTELMSWKPKSAEDTATIAVFVPLLQQSIERCEMESVNDPSLFLEKWKEECKRLRRLQAMHGLSGMGIEIRGSDYETNVRQFIRKMVSDGTSYASVFEAVRNFAQRSGEDTCIEIIHQAVTDEIKQLTVEGIRDDGDCLEAVLLCLENTYADTSVMGIQEEVWKQCLIQYKELIEHVGFDHDRYDLVQMMISILQKDIWPQRQWNIPERDMWSIFTWNVHQTLHVQDPDVKYSDQLPNSFTSEDDVHVFLQGELSKAEEMDAVFSLLDALSSNVALMEMGVMSEWLCAYYAEAFLSALHRRDPWSILKYLGNYASSGWQFPILTEEAAIKLSTGFKKMSLQLWMCFGLLLPSPSIRQEALGMVDSIEGNVDILTILLRSQPDFEFYNLMTVPSWLSRLIEECPPHHSLLPLWISKDVVETKKVETKTEHDQEGIHDVTSLAESGEGWDIDDDLEFEMKQPEVADVDRDASSGWSDADALPFEDTQETSVINPPSPGGWSDVDELETALQSVHDPQSVETEQEKHTSDVPGKEPDIPKADPVVDEAEVTGKDPSKNSELLNTDGEMIEETMSEEDRLFIGGCCFPFLLASLIVGGHEDIAVQLIAQKLRLHSLADRYTSGKLLLKRFMKISIDKSVQLSAVSLPLLESRWTAVLVRDLLEGTPLRCERAVDVLESKN